MEKVISLFCFFVFALFARENVLVTGGAGYIGSHTAKALHEAGYHPIILDNLKSGYLPHVRWGTFIKGSVQNRETLEKIFSKYDPVAVVHFAASIEVGESVKDPYLYYENNTFATLNLIDTMRKQGVHNLIFSSTCAVYGSPKKVPICESCPLQPESPYAHSKAMSEQMIRDFHKAYGLEYVIFRYFNAAGADYEAHLGDAKPSSSHLISAVLQAARRQKKMTIFGDNYSTADGTGVRDYISVVDLADAHVKALSYLLNKRASVTLNLGTGTGYSVKEVIEEAEKSMQTSIPYRIGLRREGDIAKAVADSRLAQKLLGWQPNHSNLSLLIDSAWKWDQIHHELK